MYQFFRCSVIKIVLPPRLDSSKLFGFCFHLSNFYLWEIILISCHVSKSAVQHQFVFWKWVKIVICFGSYAYISHEIYPTPVKNFVLLSCAGCFFSSFLFVCNQSMDKELFHTLYCLHSLPGSFSAILPSSVSHELWGRRHLWVLGQQKELSSYPLPHERSPFTASPSLEVSILLGLDPSLMRLSSSA